MEEPLLTQCRQLVERKLGWGPESEWVPQDFERLSAEILESTGRVVSATTLKRVWGKVKYDSTPSAHTLDTLAEFVGYEHWRAFKFANGKQASTTHHRPDRGLRQHRRNLVLGVPILVVVATLLIAGLASRAPGISGSETATFSSRPVATGLPNTVVFDYDVSSVEADSFIIQQSWDSRLRSRIDPAGHAFTSLYYYPGHFLAKLIANETIIREHPLHVTTDGWLALVEDHPVPVYIPAAGVLTDGVFQAREAWLAANGVDFGSGDDWISYYQVRDFGTLDADNFRFETAIRLGEVGGHAPCRHAGIIVMAEHARMFLPMSIPGCVSDLYAGFSDVELPGDSNDLSAFGKDMSEWQRIVLDVQDRRVTLSIGGAIALDTTYQNAGGRIVGLRYRFQGVGAIDFARLFDRDGNPVYVDEFTTE